jgi:hypothetical protein
MIYGSILGIEESCMRTFFRVKGVLDADNIYFGKTNNDENDFSESSFIVKIDKNLLMEGK